jgi:phospholipid-binding lipoprotein MlaA
VRDAVVLPIDLYGDNVWGLRDIPTRNSLTALRLVHTRANLLGIERTLEEGTLDKYAYARDFYLQQRRYKVFDGNPPNRYEDFDGAGGAPLGAGVDAVAHAAIERLELVDVGALATASAPANPR